MTLSTGRGGCSVDNVVREGLSASLASHLLAVPGQCLGQAELEARGQAAPPHSEPDRPDGCPPLHAPPPRRRGGCARQRDRHTEVAWETFPVFASFFLGDKPASRAPIRRACWSPRPAPPLPDQVGLRLLQVSQRAAPLAAIHPAAPWPPSQLGPGSAHMGVRFEVRICPGLISGCRGPRLGKVAVVRGEGGGVPQGLLS